MTGALKSAMPSLQRLTAGRHVMANLTVRNLDEDVVRRLRIRAAEHGRSAEAEHRKFSVSFWLTMTVPRDGSRPRGGWPNFASGRVAVDRPPSPRCLRSRVMNGRRGWRDHAEAPRGWRSWSMHSTYDTLYLAFAVAMGASAVMAADSQFLRSMRTHADPAMSSMVVALDAWAAARGISAGDPGLG